MPANTAAIVTRYDHRTRQARNISIYPLQPLRPRRRRTCSIAFSGPPRCDFAARSATCIYHAANVLFKSTDDGQTWKRDQRRSDAQRQDQAAVVRRPDHRRQHRRRGLRHHLRHRRIAQAKRICSGPAPMTASCMSRTTAARPGTTSRPTSMPEWGDRLSASSRRPSTRTRPMLSSIVIDWTISPLSVPYDRRRQHLEDAHERSAQRRLSAGRARRSEEAAACSISAPASASCSRPTPARLGAI